MPEFGSRPCDACKTVFTPTGARSRFCPARAEQTCSSCKSRAGRHAPTCKSATARGAANIKALKKAFKKPSRKTPPAAAGKAAPAKKNGGGLPSFEAALSFLDTQIEAAEARLTKLKAAREGMAWLTESTR